MVSIRSWVDRLPIMFGISPPNWFPEAPNTCRLVQLSKELRKSKSPICPFPKMLSSKLSLYKLCKLPRFLGTAPVRPFSAKSST
uniref:Uncharacterized protein n=1 Tax=Rhizophora mucronata TaxID=61149 RepID=A0A2P2MYP3_RHIMU